MGLMADTACQLKPSALPKAMHYSQAVKVLAEAANTELKRLNFDANLFDRGILITGLTERSSKKRKRILEAIERLQNDGND
jgi:hypothetical protein